MITGLYTTALALDTDGGVRWAMTRIALATAAEALLATGERGTEAAASILSSPIPELLGIHFPGVSTAARRYAQGVPGSARELYVAALMTGAAVLRYLRRPGDMPLLLEQLAEDPCGCGADVLTCGCPS
jgi:hypothetical protein